MVIEFELIAIKWSPSSPWNNYITGRNIMSNTIKTWKQGKYLFSVASEPNIIWVNA